MTSFPFTKASDKRGWQLIDFVGLSLLFSGLFAVGLAATIKLLPHEAQSLNITLGELSQFYDGRLVQFIAHNRVCFSGPLVGLGLMYSWLARNSLRAGEPWAWWALFLSGVVGIGSFFNFLGNGYFDIWHARATLVLAIIFGIGLVLTSSVLDVRSVLKPGARAWSWSPASIGRAWMLIWALGKIVGGAAILTVGVTHIFVPQDLEYLYGHHEVLVPDHLMPFIAHDRAGFGGALLASGLVSAITIWCGLKPASRGLLMVLTVVWLVELLTAVGVHFVIHYLSFVHLLPFVLKDLAFLLGFLFLYKPIVYADRPAERFPEL